MVCRYSQPDLALFRRTAGVDEESPTVVRMRQWKILASVALLLIVAAAAWVSLVAPLRPWAPAQHESNFRSGQAAKANFEVVSASSLPGSIRAGRADGETRVARYPLNLDPDSFDVEQEGFADFTHVTVAWREGTEKTTPFVFDLYLHGSLGEDSDAALRVVGLDIRKFLHGSTGELSEDPDLARMQAYFAEFSRKKKALYPRRSLQTESGPSRPEQAKLNRIAAALSELQEANETLPSAAQAPLKRLGAELAATHPRIAVVGHNLRQVDAALQSKDPQVVKWRPAIAAAQTEMARLAALGKIGDLALVNNCREPGNYEIGVSDALGRPLLHASFVFPPATYDEILERYQGFGIREQGTGIRIPNSIWRSDWRYALHALLPWNYLKFLPRVGIESFALPGPAQQAGALEVRRGAIPYPSVELEVRVKSGAALGQEPLAYVRVDPELPMPLGFEAPDHTRPSLYWSNPAHRGKVVPHHYRQFEDLQKYAVHLSGFEANGVYIGRSDLEVYDEEREEGRWRFYLNHLAQLQDYELRQTADGMLEIRLLSRDPSGAAVNFVLGNLALEPGEETLYLLGIGTQPLAAGYNDDFASRTPRYALAYAHDGTVLDHHDTSIGVERVWVKHTRAGDLRVQLISHERILPLWEGTLRPSVAEGSGPE